MMLFIILAIMFFFAFFWAFFHFNLSPAPTIGGVWLPIEIEILNPWEIAFLNNFIFIL